MSLLNEGTSTAPETNPGMDTAPEGQPTGQEGSNTPSWYWDENTPGSGDRPDFLPEKFKTVADMAKAQRELEKRLGQAPNEYDFSKGESWIEPDYEPFQAMAEFAKQNHVPQSVMDKMLETVGLYLDEFKPDMAEEKAKLGENATERLQLLNNWAKSNLTEKAFQVLSSTMRTADAIEALEEIRDKMLNNNTMIPSNTSSTSSGMTMEEYRSELQTNIKKYKTDSHYRNEMDKKLEQIVARQQK
jgi:hypothetical protein